MRWGAAEFLPAEKVDVVLYEKDFMVFRDILQRGDLFIQTCHRFFPSEKPFHAMTPVRTLTEIIDFATADFDNIVGVHIRRSDNQKSIAHRPTEMFVEKMQEELKTILTHDFLSQRILWLSKISLLKSFRARSIIIAKHR